MKCGSNKCVPNKAIQNGKGDKNRTNDFIRYQNNYDKINWQKTEKEEITASAVISFIFYLLFVFGGLYYGLMLRNI